MSNDSVTCGQFRRLLPPLLDEELSGRVREQVDTHLASCPTCRVELEALRADMGLLEQVGTPEVSPYLVTRVMAEIRSRRRPAAQGFGRLVRSLAAVLVVAVSIGAGVFFGDGLARSSQTASAGSTEEEVNYVESSAADMYSMLSGGD